MIWFEEDIFTPPRLPALCRSLPEKNKVFLSQIFNWYEKDFGGRVQILDFLVRYLKTDEKTHFLKKNIDNIRVEYLFYDWNLNH